MKLELRESKVDVERDQLVAVRDGAGVRVSCLSGALWVTEEHSVADVILNAGESHIIGGAGLTLVMALRSSTLRLSERRESLWSRLTAGLERSRRVFHRTASRGPRSLAARAPEPIRRDGSCAVARHTGCREATSSASSMLSLM